MPNLYIIAGCNGAGKTTASFTILPNILNCIEFINADSIAYGISPFNVEGVAFEAGRIMLKRIDELLTSGRDFAIETTLSTRSYVALVQNAKTLGYEISVIFIWLNCTEMAIQRVAERVKKGGHNIPVDIISRRYYRGIKNLFQLFIPISNKWIIADNSYYELNIIAEGKKNIKDYLEKFEIDIINNEIWSIIQNQTK